MTEEEKYNRIVKEYEVLSLKRHERFVKEYNSLSLKYPRNDVVSACARASEAMNRVRAS